VIHPIAHGSGTSPTRLRDRTTDIDGDGRVDIVMAIRGNTSEKLALETPGSQIAWYEQAAGSNWTKHVIAEEFHQASEAMAADIDGDGEIGGGRHRMGP
jgi:hypothetical protein